MTIPATSAPALVFSHSDQAVTSTLIIAQETGNDHASVIKLVRTYLADFEEFGRVGFEIAPFETNGGTQQREIALLNEQQATLLITYMRNSDVVRAFKKRLVKAFYEFANRVKHDLPQDYLAALKRLVETEEAKQLAEQKLIEQAPKVEFHDRVAASDDVYPLDQVAKLFRAGPRKFRQELKALGVFRQDGLPKQDWINRGLLRVVIVDVPLGNSGFTKPHPQPFVTSKGLTWLQRRFDGQLMGIATKAGGAAA
jgi:phage regulator Rha-like protein